MSQSIWIYSIERKLFDVNLGNKECFIQRKASCANTFEFDWFYDT